MFDGLVSLPFFALALYSSIRHRVVILYVMSAILFVGLIWLCFKMIFSLIGQDSSAEKLFQILVISIFVILIFAQARLIALGEHLRPTKLDVPFSLNT